MRKSIRTKFEICPNCDTTLDNTWDYCPKCGQSAYQIKGSVKYLLSEISGNMYSFDSKFFRTVLHLFIKPGVVASEYVSGKMVRYVPPIKLYIFATILFFLILSFRSCTKENEKPSNISLNTNISFNDKTLTNKDLLKIPGFSKAQLDSFITSSGAKPSAFRRSMLVKTAKISETGFDTFFEEVKANAALGMFLLMPLSALILYLFYRKKRKLYFDHLIAAVYLHTAIFILFILNQITSLLLNFDWFFGVLVIFYIYLIWSLHNFYVVKWKKAIFISMPIVFIYFVFLIFFIIVVTLTSFVTF